MKKSSSKAMREMLKRGLAKARKRSLPSDGMMSNLIYETKPNGWHYQVELIHDSRFHAKPIVAVYAFRPPRRYHARGADLVLEGKAK